MIMCSKCGMQGHVYKELVIDWQLTGEPIKPCLFDGMHDFDFFDELTFFDECATVHTHPTIQ